MNSDKMTFYGAIVLMLCLTFIVSNCAYQQSSCHKEALKANVDPEKIHAMCKISG